MTRGEAVGPLRHLRVVEASTGLAGGYAGKLFVDAGADVVKVEPEGGDPLRGWTVTDADPGDQPGAVFEYLAAGKRSVVGRIGDAEVAGVIQGADVVIMDLPGAALRASGLLDDGGLVVLSLRPFGGLGPLADRPATEFVVQAECGSLAARGRPDRTPVQAGGRLAEWAGGVYGAAAALAAADHAARTGRGAHIDVSLQEVMCICTNLFADLMLRMLGVSEPPQPPRTTEFPSIEPTADGWVAFNTNAAEMFNDFLVLIGRADLLEGHVNRNDPAQRPELEASATAWARQHTTAEVIEQASLFRIPVAAVPNGETLPQQEHLAARGIFQPAASGRFVRPLPPYLIDGERLGTDRPCPEPGEHTGTIERRQRRAQPTRDSESDNALPFAGFKVLDLTSWWAGPAQFLAALGADVIHVESVQRIDGMRPAAAMPFVGRDRWWEYSPFFLNINVNKRGLTLDLSDPRGRELALRLVRWSDLVIENYTPRVMGNLGLDWETVHAANPNTVMVRMPAYGLDGPWRDRVGFAQTMEAMSGLAWITGYADGPPTLPRGPCDPGGAMHAAFALQVALAQRDTLGAGVLVEAPLIESALNMAAPQVLEYAAYGRLLTRDGNRSAGCAPQGVYACAGTEQWLAVSVATDEQWQALRRLLGEPDWATGDLDTYRGRCQAQDVLDAELGRWAAPRQLGPTVELLAAAGVPAGAVVDHRTVSAHPQLVARGFLETVEHPVAGSHALFGMPFRYGGIDEWIRTPAPTLGQHNHEILHGLLGLGDEEIAALAADKVIGESPARLE
jgi:crotonobetainyl-CoA:carnitine CoA-transferase CaiB-like acyl-CoA transferase